MMSSNKVPPYGHPVQCTTLIWRSKRGAAYNFEGINPRGMETTQEIPRCHQSIPKLIILYLDVMR